MSDRSLNEIRALALKAVRGAGASWGLSEEAGAATRWLEARGAPGVKALAQYLIWRDGRSQMSVSPALTDGIWMAPAGVLCPLSLGAMICDRPAILRNFRAGSVFAPVLLEPFVEWSGLASSLAFGDGDAGAPRDVRATAKVRDLSAVGHRAAPEPDDLATLERFAARTYAPATKASRAAGAGGGSANED